MARFNITIKATSVTVYPCTEALPLLDPLLDLMTYEDEFLDKVRTLGFMTDSSTDTLYLHKGVNVEYIRKLLGDVSIKMEPFDRYKEMNFEFEEIIAPRDTEQVDVINFICAQQHHADTINSRQIFLVKKPGFGKTYCTGYGMGKLGLKTLIIMHRDSLRKQWLDSLYRMNGLTDKDVHEISSSEELYNIAHNTHGFDYDVYLMTHATFRAGMKRIGNMKDASNIAKNLGIGLKVIDEAHLEFRDTLLIDFTFNVYRNLYLTATDGRSSKDENSIFKHVFSNTTFYKPSSLLSEATPKRWVEYITMKVNTNVPKPRYKYRIIGGRGMSAISYGKFVIACDKKQLHFKCCRDLLKLIYSEDEKAKVIVFMPLIDLCTEAAHYFTKELDNDPEFDYSLTIRTINSKNGTFENERNKAADVIVTTVQSAGTGTDIPGITTIISCSPFYSSILAQQVFGRIRYCGKQCKYYDIWDESVPMDKLWLKNRRKVLGRFATKVTDLSWEENTDNDQ